MPAEPRFSKKFIDVKNEHATVAQDLLRKLIMNGEKNPRILAQALKRKFDETYGPTWFVSNSYWHFMFFRHCVIGNSFGSMVSHRENSFLYMYVDNQAVILFKSA
ncbi:Dynein light chain [Aphelenchoides besseyi]|nr:Dynein light chain [Aphelenchoides besseyi]